MSKILTIILIFFIPTFALGEIPEPPEDLPWWGSMLTYALNQFPEINAWFAAAMLAIMSILRASASFLMFIASKTETKADDDIAQLLSKFTRWVGAVIGWFGLGKPKG